MPIRVLRTFIRLPSRCQIQARLVRACLALVVAGAGPLLAAGPAAALQRVQLRLPLLETDFTLDLADLASLDGALVGDSDLAEFDQALGGSISRKLRTVFQTPLPLQARAVLNQAVGTPLLEQALLVASALVQVKGLPPDPEGRQLVSALETASASGNLTLLTLLQALPGEVASIDLERATQGLLRLARQQRRADALLASVPAAAPAPATVLPPVQRRSFTLAVPYRSQPLELLVFTPEQRGNGRLVVISHGLWDRPESFAGWGQRLAASGYTVVLPNHPGSDGAQQRAMLTGTVPPPGPAELRLRPLDVSAVIDAIAAHRLAGLEAVAADRVVVFGHSWGATTSLQLAGLQPSSRQLRERCRSLDDPARNVSWTLQCSWLSGADQAGLADPRVIAVAAVSPPATLLFDQGSGLGMQARVLLVSGSRDWVVPADPEAIEPFGRTVPAGHRLVLAGGGDHFNLRPGEDPGGGVLGSLLLRWTEAAFAAGDGVRPGPAAGNLLPPSGWGDARISLVDVTAQVQR